MNPTSRLRQFIAQESEALKATLRMYLRRAGLDDSADDLLNEVVVEALRHERRYQSDRPPRAWLLGIAANLIKRRQAEQARRRRREPLVRDLYPNDPADDDALFDRAAALAQTVSRSPDTPETQIEIDALLGGISSADAEILRLAILHELDGAALAEQLGISAGAARVRLHRALTRLRGSLTAAEAVTEAPQTGWTNPSKNRRQQHG